MAPAEDLPVTRMSDIYPGIDPKPHFAEQTYQGKVVLVTGASRGIGEEIALFYARAGASLSLVGRKSADLLEARTRILAHTSDAQIQVFVADVVDTQAVKAAVEGTVKAFGRLDIVIANAGKADPWKKPFTESDPDNWWKTMEVNIRGVYNIAHFALPELAKSKGYNIIISSVGAQMRMPFASSYVTSKHAVNRLNEYIHAEHPAVKTFALNPGAIKTSMADNNPEAAPWLIDTLQLPAATCLRLTSGKEGWLSGRYVSANWELDEVESDWKAKIIDQDALVNRLHVP
ncbi:NAD-P-binding protein [Mycena albidolilacea]|uniref:NAD-P-binding protein n=1 Tax=Mycena albidolilacea TaxID=1033008 RepID=A0AAD7ATG2_9AGAR|nr:NAD-P-binding protein [Mycena albidolilacea]